LQSSPRQTELLPGRGMHEVGNDSVTHDLTITPPDVAFVQHVQPSCLVTPKGLKLL